MRLKAWILPLVLLLLLSSQNGLAGESPRVLSIEVEGNRFVEKETILARMDTRPGLPLDRKTLSRDIRRLYHSGDFRDVRVEGVRSEQGVRLKVRVEEYPLIAKVNLIGNEEVKSKDLRLRLKLKPGYVLSPALMNADRNTIRKGYLKKGYYQVRVEFIPHPLKDGRVDLDIRIDEGDVTRIQRIAFIGNQAFSDGELADAIASRRSDLISWFTDRDVFDRKRFGADGQLLLQYYQNHGFLDAKLESSRLSMSEDKRHFDLTFAIDEGAQYRVSSLQLKGDIVPDEKTLQELIKLEEGEVYSLQKLQESVTAITDRVGDEGYAFATVTPLFHRDLTNHTVAIDFDIEKGAEVYVERIEIAGNEKTEDHVIRRVLKQSEAERYSASQIRRSKEELKRSPLYEDVRVSLPRGSDEHKVDMKLDMTEKKSGSFSFGIGYSQLEKTIFNAKISENNILGKGYQGSLNGTFGSLTQNYTASFTDPYFLGKNLSASVNLYKNQTDPLATVSYRQDSQGGGIGFGIPLGDHLRYNIGYQYSSTTLSGIAANASLLLRAQQGTQTIGELNQTLSWDSRDRAIAPASGHYDYIRGSIAGLGGNNRFWEAEVSTAGYFAFGEKQDIVFNPSFNARMINPIAGREILLSRRYSMGGIGSIRGFDSYGISLRDQNGEAVGGDRQLRASLNLFAPFPYMNTPGFRLVLFADTGTVWGKVATTVGNQAINIEERFSLSSLRFSAGFGIEWISPVGPIAFVWGFPLRKLPGDIERNFEFALGGSF